MGHAPRSIAESRQVASSEIRRLKASPAGSSIERKAGRRRRDRRGSHACVHVTLNEVTGYGDDCANYRPAGAGAKVLEDAAPARRRAPGPNASASRRRTEFCVDVKGVDCALDPFGVRNRDAVRRLRSLGQNPGALMQTRLALVPARLA